MLRWFEEAWRGKKEKDHFFSFSFGSLSPSSLNHPFPCFIPSATQSKHILE